MYPILQSIQSFYHNYYSIKSTIQFNNMGQFQSNNFKTTTTGCISGVTYTSCEMQGWRKDMEDTKIAQLSVKGGDTIYSVFGVFDGHGGTEVSKFVEAHFVQELSKNESFKKGDIAEALEQLFYRMDEMLLSPEANQQINKIRNNPAHHNAYPVEQSFAGCTANVIVFDKDNYWMANAGDSRSALSRAGKLIILSEDHKPELPIEKQRIQKAGGVIIDGRVNGGLNLSRAIGDFEYKTTRDLSYKQQMITCHPDVKKVPRHPDDQFIIMGCDGIWQKYQNDSQLLLNNLAERRKTQKNSKELMQELLDSMLARTPGDQYGSDNMTAILIEFDSNRQP